MKKSFIKVLGISAMSLGFLTGCGPAKPVTPEVPTEEGKITFFLKNSSESVAMKDYESIYFAGGLTGFATGLDAPVFTKLEGSEDIFYFMMEADMTKGQANEYKVLKGYNETSGMPQSKQGLQWNDNYQSKECPIGTDNCTFEWTEGSKTVDLGTHTWENSVKTPSDPLTNINFVVNFEEAVPEYGKVLIFGSMNGWATPGDTRTDEENARLIEEATMTPSEDRKTWTLHYDSIYADKYNFKVLVEYNDKAGAKEAKTSISWNNIEETPDNVEFELFDCDEPGDYEILGTGVLAHFTLPDPAESPLRIVLHKSETSGDLPETVETLYVCGNFTNWKHVAMEVDELDPDVYVFEGGATAGEKQFGIMSKTDWSDKCVAEGGANFSFDMIFDEDKLMEVTVDADYSKFSVAEQAGKLQSEQKDIDVE